MATGTGGSDSVKPAIYYLLNANAGTHTLSLSSLSGNYFGWTLVEFPPATAVDVTQANFGNAAVTTATPAPRRRRRRPETRCWRSW